MQYLSDRKYPVIEKSNMLLIFLSHSYDGLSNIYNAAHICFDNDEIAVYFKLYVLLDADNTILLVDSKAELQCALNVMQMLAVRS